jgi:hypothetical protein
VPHDVTAGDIVGFRVLGTHGELGVVVDLAQPTVADPELLVVRGGISNALTYYIPADRVRTFSRKSRTILVDVDLVDFVPHLDEEGRIELRAAD